MCLITAPKAHILRLRMNLSKPQPLLQSQRRERCRQGVVCPFPVKLKAFWLHLCPVYVTRHTETGMRSPGPSEWALSPCNEHNRLFAAGEPAEGSGGCRGHDGCDKGDVIPELLRPGRIPKTQGLPGDRDVLPNGTGVEWQGSGWVGGSWGLLLGQQQAWQKDTCSSRMAQHHVKEQQTTCLCTGLHASSGNGSFSNQCVSIKHRIWLCFHRVFMTEQAPHLLYYRAIPALFLTGTTVWKPLEAIFRALTYSVGTPAASGYQQYLTRQQRPMSPPQENETTVMLCEAAWGHQELEL